MLVLLNIAGKESIKLESNEFYSSSTVIAKNPAPYWQCLPTTGAAKEVFVNPFVYLELSTFNIVC